MSKNAFVALFSALLAALLAVFTPFLPLVLQVVCAVGALALLIVAGNFLIRAIGEHQPKK